MAFRRLLRPDDCDRELEQFLLEAAALRVRLNEEAQEIAGILDETSVTGDAPVYGRARMTARVADGYLWRFEHLVHQSLLAGDGSQGRQLQVLRMRLMRDYSGLWLLAYKPLFLRRVAEASDPEVYPLRLEPREVTAYRRVFGRKEHDAELERFLLEAAALRVRINDEAQEITSILDETSVTGDAPIYNRARATARLADSYLWRFQHLLDERLFAGDLSEGRQIQLLRMRLMRDYSGLWLLAYKPVLAQRRPGGTLV